MAAFDPNDAAVRPLTSGSSELVVDVAADYTLHTIGAPADPTGVLSFKRDGRALRRHAWSLEAGRDYVLMREGRVVVHARAGDGAHRLVPMG